MPILSIGDLASTFQIRRQSTGLKADLSRLGRELATGLRTDLGAQVSGDFGPIAAIERSLTAISAYRTSNAEAAGLFDATQITLGAVQQLGRDLTPGLLTAASSRDPAMIHATAQDARQKFQASIAALNTRAADRTLLAGAATDRPAMAGADTIMAALVAAAAGETTAAGVTAALDAWFDTPGGGFETVAYLGADSSMGPMTIANGETVDVTTRADDPALREALKAQALAALIAEGVLDSDRDQQAALIATASQRSLAADGQITNLRAEIGAVEARVENAGARNAAEASAYEIARIGLIGADPYDTATELEAVYARIEMLYTVTARIAGLKFTDYMR